MRSLEFILMNYGDELVAAAVTLITAISTWIVGVSHGRRRERKLTSLPPPPPPQPEVKYDE